MPYEKEFLLSLYRKMVLIRKFEERIKYLFLEGIMPDTIHQYQGQEAIAVGFCSALEAGDVITSTHRPHGHAGIIMSPWSCWRTLSSPWRCCGVKKLLGVPCHRRAVRSSAGCSPGLAIARIVAAKFAEAIEDLNLT